jgi:hypothetical protein
MLDALATTDLLDNPRLLIDKFRRKQHQDRFTDRFVRGVSKHSLGGRIPAGDGAFQCFANDRVFRGIDDCCEASDCFFRLVAIGDVACGASDGLHLSSFAEDRNENVVVDASSKRAGKRNFAANGCFGGSDAINFLIVHCGMPRLIAEFQAGPANRLVPGFSPHLK